MLAQVLVVVVGCLVASGGPFFWVLSIHFRFRRFTELKILILPKVFKAILRRFMERYFKFCPLFRVGVTHNLIHSTLTLPILQGALGSIRVR